MANYRKSFNLRNGVQIDDDNFIVNPNGLVGIGTSIPTEFLDIRGNAKIVGFVTANSLYAGIATVGVLSATQGVSVTGIVTATSFSGSASGLTGIYAIAVDGWYVNSSNSTISTSFSVGIGTTIPRGNLQVGTGVTINSTGNASYTGIVTALSFAGFGTNITGIDAVNISSGTLNNSRLPSNINVAGIITAISGFRGNVTGIASTALSLSGSPSITVTNISANNYNSSGILTTRTINAQIGIITSINSGFSTSGISTIYTLLNIAPLGAIGVGTNNPNAVIHIRDANTGASVQLTSDNGNEAYISIGGSVTRTGNNGDLRFGNTNVSQKYSTTSSLDVINYGLGNLNNYLHLGSIAGINTGSFNWIYGKSANSPLMTLTYGGCLGLGITTPTNTLHVVGTSTVTGSSYVNGNLTVDGNLTINSLLTANNFSVTTFNANSITGTFIGNINTSGISTLGTVLVTGITSVTTLRTSGNIGIKTNVSQTYPVIINSGSNYYTSNQIIINDNGGIGIGTTIFNDAPGQSYNVSIDAARGVAYFQGVGVGTTTPSCFADFSAAGSNHINFGDTLRFMIPPKVSNSGRSGLSTVPGAIIYNTSTNKHQGFNGSAWFDLY